MIVGRDQELQVLDSFVNPDLWPAAVTLTGEAGIGISTLLEAGVSQADHAGIRTVVARPTELDADLPFTTLTDLCSPLVEEFGPAIPEPQRRALAVALLREDGARLDPRGVSAATLSLVRAAVAAEPLLIAIDDAQYVDPNSDRALGFALRRLGGARVGILVAVRGPEDEGLPSEMARAMADMDVTFQRVGALGIDALGAVIADETGEPVPQRELGEIHRVSGGNPLFAVALARSLRRGDDRPTGAVLPVPRSLREDLVRRRSAQLSAEAAEALLVAAAVSRPTTPLLHAVLPDVSVDDALDEAAASGIVTVAQGDVQFTHPLYRSAVYADASRAHRHRVHAGLAAAIDDPDERARHLALSMDEPDAAAASAIADAASRARAAGAPELAVQLLAHAIRLTPPGSTEELAQRTLAIAEERFRIGDPAAASDAVRAVALEPADPRKAVALATAGRIERLTWRFADARTHLEQALEHVSEADGLAGEIHAELFWTFVALGDVVTASDHAGIGLDFGRATDEPAVRARTYGAAAHARFLRDGVPADDLRAEAPDLWEPISALPVGSWPLSSRTAELVAVGDISASRDLIEGLLSAAEEHGDEPSRISLLAMLASIDLDEGHWTTAAASARLAIELSSADLRSLEPISICAWLEAMMGERAASMHDIARGLELVAEVGMIAAAGPSLGRLATAELVLSGPAGSGDALIAMLPATPSPERHWFDAADVLIALGRYDEATALTATLEKGADLRPMAAGLGARARGMIAAARGDLATAEASLVEGRRLLSATPFEQARAALALGTVRRRLAHKREAREALYESRATFERLGAMPWILRVDEELGHITGRRPSKGTLTDAETRVARLAASGLRNREIAEQLVMSVRTVEGHLSNVYAKIGVRSRTELVLFFDDPADG